MADTKACTRCGRELPLDSYYGDKKAKDGHQGVCKDCSKELVRISAAKRRARKKAEKEAQQEAGYVTWTPPTIQAVEAPETGGKAARLADFTDEQILAELKRRGFFCRDLYKYVKIDFESI